MPALAPRTLALLLLAPAPAIADDTAADDTAADDTAADDTAADDTAADDTAADDTAAPLDPAPDLLGPAVHAPVRDALRRVGLEPADLLGGRETTNAGLPRPADRWRLPAAEAALHDPLGLPALVGDRRAAMAADLRAPLPAWGGVRHLATAEPGAAVPDRCRPAPPRGLWQEAVDTGLLDRRQRRYLRDRLDPRLDALAGQLLAEARLARCRVEVALGGLDPAARHSLAEDLHHSVLADEEHAPDAAEGGAEEARFRRAWQRAWAWEQVDRALLLDAGLAWSEAVHRATGQLDALPVEAWPGGPLRVVTPLGEVWIGSPGADRLDGDPVLLLDPGGDDDWRVASGQDLPTAAARPVRGWVDLDGDDAWSGAAVGAGGALLGVAAGVDLRGDDRWRTGPLAQGAAWFGVATWLDAAGADTWDGPAAVQGFAGHGLGVLRDAGEGADTYRAGAYAQGAALTGGVGLLHEAGGSDRYVLGARFEDNGNRLPGHYNAYGQGFAIGSRPWLGGGIGWLQDEAGHDQYTGGLWAQGSSYWHALGVLVDGAGNDVYVSDQYSQGAGIHLSAAGLFELGGDDRYLTRYLGQGSGHDLAVSWLYDAAGDDVYAGQDTVQGTALTNAVSFFVDAAGDDQYAARTRQRHGWTGQAREHGSAALFLDLAGVDLYLVGAASQPERPDGPGGHGLALDLGPPEAAAPEASPGGAPTGMPGGEATLAAAVPTDADAARALLLAHTRWLAPWPETMAACDLLHAAGPRAVAWLLPLADSEMHLRSYTIEAVVQRWAAGEETAGRAEVAAAIRASLEAWPVAAEDAAPRWHLRWLGLLSSAAPARGAPAPVEAALAGADLGRAHPAWAVRREAWHLARQLVTQGAVPRIMRATWRDAALHALDHDPLPPVQAAAARFLAADGHARAAPALARALARGGLEGRDTAEQALVALARAGHADPVLAAVQPLATDATGPTRDAALRVSGATRLPAALPTLEAGLRDADPLVRRAAAYALAAHGSRAAVRLLARHRKIEEDPMVLAALGG